MPQSSNDPQWFLEHASEFMNSTVTRAPPVEHLWDVVEWGIDMMDVQLMNLQQLNNSIMVELTENL